MISETFVYIADASTWLLYHILWVFRRKTICKDVMQLGTPGAIIASIFALDIVLLILCEPNGFNMGSLNGKKTIILLGCLSMIGLGIHTIVSGFKNIYIDITYDRTGNKKQTE